MTISHFLSLEAALQGLSGAHDTPAPGVVAQAQRRRPLLLRQALGDARADSAQWLLAHGWRPDLHDCAALGDLSGLAAHLADGHPDDRDLAGASPLHYAAHHGHGEVVDRLLISGAHASLSWSGLTPLHLAAAGGHLAVTNHLLRAGASPHRRDEAEFQPLHHAAAGAHPSVVRRLLQAGADPDALVGTTTPTDLARRAGCQRTLGLLLQVGSAPLAAFSRR